MAFMNTVSPIGIACPCIAECDGSPVGLRCDIVCRPRDAEMFPGDDLAVVVFEVSLDGEVAAALDDAGIRHADDVL